MRYWNNQDRFPVAENDNIDWDVIKHARKLLTFDRQIWMTKQVSGFCGTGINMKLWNFREDSIYLLCNETEDNIHILRCKSKDDIDRWTASIATLEQNHAPPNTVDMIVNQLHIWRDNTGNIPSCTSVSLSNVIVA